MEVFTWVFGLIIPAIMIIAGLFMWKKPPKKINSMIGYRTSSSMKNQQTWDFAHYHAGRIWTYVGLITLGASVLALIFVPLQKDNVLIGLSLVQTAILIICIFPTQVALKRNFDEFGYPRK